MKIAEFDLKSTEGCGDSTLAVADGIKLRSEERAPASDASDYGQVLSSSAIVGGAQVITMVISLVRVKLVALLIGPAGIGLVGLYQSVIGIAATLAGMGIETSGVRDVAAAAGNDDRQRIAQTVLTLRRVCWITGLLGCLILYLSADFLSWQTFGSNKYVWPIRLLGLTILMGNIAGGQSAIIQGTRRIRDLAVMRIYGAIGSTIVVVGFYIALGMEGIVPALLANAAVMLTISTLFARRVPLQSVDFSWRQSLLHTRGLLSLGLAFVWSGLLTLLVAYLTQVWIAREINLEAVGIYAAAFALSGIFVQFVLQAMGADYYPRLTAVAQDHSAMNRVINQQTEIGLLLAFPGLLATLSLAPALIYAFYTAEFTPAAALLKWFVLGCMSRVLSWPLGFSILALGRGALFAVIETSFNLLHLAAIWISVHYYGLEAVSISFAVLNSCLSLGMLVIANRLTEFQWSTQVTKMLAWMLPCAAVVFCLDYLLQPLFATLVGATASVIASFICLRQLVSAVGNDHKLSRILLRIPGGEWLTRQSHQL